MNCRSPRTPCRTELKRKSNHCKKPLDAFQLAICWSDDLASACCINCAGSTSVCRSCPPNPYALFQLRQPLAEEKGPAGDVQGFLADLFHQRFERPLK